jgi:tRNA(His) 5'-end guanylyltransferase
MKKNGDSLGDRMKKQYEIRSQSFLPRRTYAIIRLDGCHFHSYTRDLQRPYDKGLMDDMNETAKFLCENIQGCAFAYVQSDEISLLLTDFADITTEAWFDGNVQKITSISAAMAAAKFNELRLMRLFPVDSSGMRERHISQADVIHQKLAFFDSRVFTIPDPVEVENYFIWRQQDATRNSIQMVAQSKFSQKELQNKSTNVLQEMLWSKHQINWNNYNAGFKRGRIIAKRVRWQPAVDGIDYRGSFCARGDQGIGLEENPVAGTLAWQGSQLMVARSRWEIDAPPVFTKKRDYLIELIPPYLSAVRNPFEQMATMLAPEMKELLAPFGDIFGG